MPLIKTRFAPSPTGLIHLGNMRTALFNVLLARHNNGTFLLRIEDTDRIRSEKEYANSLIEDMHWLGLSWQEGPFWQSERQAIYNKFYADLETKGLAYPCFCSEPQLALNRKIQRAAGKPPRYPGTCSSLTAEEIEKKKAAGLKPTLRFRIPDNQEIKFNDLVRGEQVFNSSDIGDFIIRRADGTSPFMFCSALDDSLMGITHVLRGEDHLTNTPRQIMILRALGLPVPQYGHISLILGDDGSPLSKRNGSRSMHELREHGFLPAALLNYLARLGHHYDNDKLIDLDTLAKYFSASALSHAPAKFDFNQLLYWQKQAVAHLNPEEFLNWMGQETRQLIPDAKLKIFISIIQHNVLFPEEIRHWAKILCTDAFSFTDEQKAMIKDTGILFFNNALSILEKYSTDFHAFIGALSETLSIKGKALYMPLRIALTGERHGPELVHIFEILGKEKIKSRFELATTVLHHS